MATQKPSIPKKILLLTNIDRGEANVFLATSHALLQADPDVKLHFATFGGFEASVISVWRHARRTLPYAKPITFHEIEGLPMAEALRQYFSRKEIPWRNNYLPESFLAPPGLSNTPRAIRDTAPIFIPYSGPQLVDIFFSIVEIINKVAADLVVVDSLMTPALTACYHLGVKFTCLSPNAIKEFAASTQPLGAGLWKYPATLPELDFQAILPPHVFPCGPIIRSAPPISDTEPGLERWLARGPTVYINLGSICLVTEDQASELAMAVKTVIDTVKKQSDAPQLQVLWKLKKCGEYRVLEAGSRIYEILGKEIQADLVRIVDWILAEPIALLQTGHIDLSAGVRQVVLPQWTDCYDYAQRVEMLGIGRWGSRTTKPQWSAQELARELLDVLLGERSDAMKQKARELAELCQKSGSGAVTAARILLAECQE
ncbi:hypothetical protein OEA41_006275 [Lepraria neglecta]|uniref:Uncharacterized protein n=1 Tax=Lepraria neglecta TaxID=209136 RepID=A0AAD9Z7B7_9LECA|nr:hypothetical protein OEA41_006275 [Lepraria neglecta]